MKKYILALFLLITFITSVNAASFNVSGTCSNQYTSYWNNVFYFEGDCPSGTKIEMRFDTPLTGSGDTTVYESMSVYNGTVSIFSSLFNSSIIRGFSYNSLCEVDSSASWCSWYPSAKYNSNSLTLYRYYNTSYSLSQSSIFDISGNIRFAYNINISNGDISNTILTTFETGRQHQDAQNTQDTIDRQTNAILNEDTTYNNNASENIDGKDDMDDLSDAEQGLLNDLDFSGAEDIDITINAQASSFIWQIVNQLRNMNGSIILLITSMLGLGIIKMILNR